VMIVSTGQIVGPRVFAQLGMRRFR
jgi:hypothetical protein